MPRPQLPIGTLGEISTTEFGKRRVRARARYRDLTGKTRQLEATSTSATAARRAPERTFSQRMAAAGDLITPSMRVAALAEVWVAEIAQSSRSPQTVAEYRRIIETVIVPGVGGLALWEATTGQLDRFLKGVAAQTPGRAKTVLAQMFGLAARHDAARANPVPDTRLPQRRPKAVRALSVDEVPALRRGLRAYLAEPVKSGPARAQDLAEVVDVALGTGARVGELLALRWADVDVGASPVTVTISGTVVRTDAGLIRQGHAKTAAGFGTVSVPRFAADVPLRRSVEELPNTRDLVFPSSTGTLREVNNLERQWRDARKSEHLQGFEWVTWHTFRKTVATLVDRSWGTEYAAAVLGHSGTAVTSKHYVQRANVAPDVSAALEVIGDDV
ncbi:tyrosine-type recombinase/integrase [Kocuria palustris]|uniref:tyrosine-type recombinase/integrase n=1 Tax=Kocuria palustris TaxID=71999 RepID=UPI003BF7831C